VVHDGQAEQPVIPKHAISALHLLVNSVEQTAIEIANTIKFDLQLNPVSSFSKKPIAHKIP
jgi:hypothetical protein